MLRPSHKRQEPRTLARVKNLLVLSGPGPGLAEAGGLATPSVYWNFENVLQKKSNFIDLISKRLSMPRDASKLAQETKQGGSAINFRQRMKLAASAAAKRAYSTALEMSARTVDIEISNVTFQYDDTQHVPGQGHVTVGCKLDYFAGVSRRRPQGDLSGNAHWRLHQCGADQRGDHACRDESLFGSAVHVVQVDQGASAQSGGRVPLPLHVRKVSDGCIGVFAKAAHCQGKALANGALA